MGLARNTAEPGASSLRGWRVAAFFVAAGLVTVVAPRRAGVETRVGDTAPDKELKLAKESFEAAQQAFVCEEFEKAADKFLSAFEHKPFPAFIFNAAVAFEKAKRLDQAKEYFGRYLSTDPAPATPHRSRPASTCSRRYSRRRRLLLPRPSRARRAVPRRRRPRYRRGLPHPRRRRA